MAASFAVRISELTDEELMNIICSTGAELGYSMKTIAEESGRQEPGEPEQREPVIPRLVHPAR